ncbi:tripartite tricarboxylate transporter substrate binding protein [Verticiella sediminum]|uniref:Tripartite tricarboxylate transporter substrate binding protein n=1 Tax=Verticiella sediminum TaxID=1247510 RepID=A0A556B0D7_9BURK|nr:tripartite tricarboxylate transporter substrate binding protein [Verticiella sediminum]TSH98604.1 tripartite tricarboxylate transporter substrate binding protein [Verticiella sediminum]
MPSRFAAAALLAASCALPVATLAAGFPDKPVRIIVPYPAGGTADVLPRLIGQKLGDLWGQPVIIDNRAGAGGNIGADAAAKAAPDGYTLLATPPAPLVINQYLYANLPYDAEALTPITTLAAAPNVLAVRKDFPAKTPAEFIAYAQANPGAVSVATQGNGTTSHLTGAMFGVAIDTRFMFVPYRGTSPALADLMGGQVDVFFDNIGSMYPQHKSGTTRILAVAGPERSPLLPEVPTLAESGLKDFESVTWFGLVAPPGTPDAIADQLNADIARVLAMPEIAERFREQGVAPVGEPRAEAAAFMQRERERWKAVIDATDVAVN